MSIIRDGSHKTAGMLQVSSKVNRLTITTGYFSLKKKETNRVLLFCLNSIVSYII